jgi:hypothetical protein
MPEKTLAHCAGLIGRHFDCRVGARFLQVSSANIVALLEAASAAPRDRSVSSDNGSGSTVAGWQAGDAASSTRGGASLLTADDFVNTRRALCPASTLGQ